jgi:hypothetical protein
MQANIVADRSYRIACIEYVVSGYYDVLARQPDGTYDYIIGNAATATRILTGCDAVPATVVPIQAYSYYPDTYVGIKYVLGYRVHYIQSAYLVQALSNMAQCLVGHRTCDIATCTGWPPGMQGWLLHLAIRWSAGLATMHEICPKAQRLLQLQRVPWTGAHSNSKQCHKVHLWHCSAYVRWRPVGYIQSFTCSQAHRTQLQVLKMVPWTQCLP